MNSPLFMDCPESFVHILHWAKQHSVFSLLEHLTLIQGLVNHTINTIKHNGTKQRILISVLDQNAPTSRILEPRPQGLISSIIYEQPFIYGLPRKLRSYVALGKATQRVFTICASHYAMPTSFLYGPSNVQFCSKVLDLTCFSQCWLCFYCRALFSGYLEKRGQNLVKNRQHFCRKLVKLQGVSI